MWLIFLIIIILVIVVGYHLYASTSGGKAFVKGEFYLGADWFEQVKKGKKTIDTRPGSADKYTEYIKKSITYFHKDKTIKAKVIAVKHYKTLEEMLEKEDLSAIAPHIKGDKEIKKALEEYYTPDKVKDAGGINAIHISV